MKRGKYRVLGGDKMKCWWCKSKTNASLTLIDGSEVWCCEKCAWIHGRIRKFRRKYELECKSLKISQNSLVKNKETAIAEAML